MKLKSIFLAVTLAIFAGVFVFTQTAFAQESRPWDVVATITHQNATYTYRLSDEIVNNTQNAANRAFFSGMQGKKQLYDYCIEQGISPDAAREYVLPGFTKILKFFSFAEVTRRDATVTFGKNGFTYCNGQNGVSINCNKLFSSLLQSGGKDIRLPLPLLINKATTVEELKTNTVKKGSFTTTFYTSGANRVFNIALATNAVCGTTVGVGETFSFNQIVGKRTEENGYKPAKVIQDGVYADGIGGGVCQVSTTLYNALLLAGIVPTACQHTLVPSYVEAGFDAMVSDGGADLTFTNTTEHPLYILGKVDSKSKSVTFTVYGAPNTHVVRRQSISTRTPFNTVEVVDKAKYPELVYTNQTKVITSGSDGVKSQSFLDFYLNGQLVEHRQIRQNTYAKVDRVVARGYLLPD